MTAAPIAYAAILNGDGRNNTLYGTSGRDTIKGNGGNDLIYGYGGSDTLRRNRQRQNLWMAQSQQLYGNDGNDYMIATNGGNEDDGPNFMYRGARHDRMFAYGCDGCGTGFYISGGSGNDHIEGYDAPREIYGGSGDDMIYASGDTHYEIFGGGGSDEISVNTDSGGALHGGKGGDDYLFTNDGRLFGDDGDDTLKTEWGDSEYTGGSGADQFLCSEYEGDVVTDYNPSEGDVVSSDCEEF